MAEGSLELLSLLGFQAHISVVEMELRASRVLGKLYQLNYILMPPCTEYCLASQEGHLELMTSVSEPSQTPCGMLRG